MADATNATPREELFEQIARAICDNEPGGNLGDWERAGERTRKIYRRQAFVAVIAIEAHEGGCWIAPNELTPAMRASVGKVVHQDDLGPVYSSMRGRAPCARPAKEGASNAQG